MVRIAVVGAGFGGIGLTVRLEQAGLSDVTVYERADDVGGVWRENTYPGAACDIPSHLYSFSFAPKADWSRRYAEQPEIRDYLRDVAERFDVLRHVRFGSEVVDARWADGRWHVTTRDGSCEQYDVVVAACGQLSTPQVPDLPGGFGGTQFHSAQWRHDHDLTGRRVAVIGTGASAIQFVPPVARHAAHVSVFQRTAPYVVPKRDAAIAGVEHRLMHTAPGRVAARAGVYAWNELRSLGFNTRPALMQANAKRFLQHLEQAVPDPELRAKVTPTDPMGCKRILISNDWYPTLQLPHVDLVTEKVVELVAQGVRTADGLVHEADTLIWGTGFATQQLLTPMEVVGRERSLAAAWAAGAEAHLGVEVAGFPNLFLLYGPNTNLGHNSIVYMLESQYAYVLQAVQRLARGDVREVEVRPEVQRAFVDWVRERSAGTVFAGGCTSWYLTADGRNTINWPASTLTYRRRTSRWRPEEHLLR